MKRIHVKGNTWVLEGPQLVGLYQIDESTCLLLDPGSTKLQGDEFRGAWIQCVNGQYLGKSTQQIQSMLTKHANDITLNKKLFERIKFVHDHPNRELTPEEKMLLDTSYDGFVRSGDP